MLVFSDNTGSQFVQGINRLLRCVGPLLSDQKMYFNHARSNTFLKHHDILYSEPFGREVEEFKVCWTR